MITIVIELRHLHFTNTNHTFICNGFYLYNLHLTTQFWWSRELFLVLDDQDKLRVWDSPILINVQLVKSLLGMAHLERELQNISLVSHRLTVSPSNSAEIMEIISSVSMIYNKCFFFVGLTLSNESTSIRINSSKCLSYFWLD